MKKHPRTAAKRFLAVILFAVISICLLSSPALAEDTGFSDVGADDWFAPYVEVCAEKGLLNGVGDGKFDPAGVLNNDEALVMAARVLLMANGETEFPKGPDAQGFWDWAGWNKGQRFNLGNSVAETQWYVDAWCWDPLFYLAQRSGPELFKDGVTYAASRHTFFKALAFAVQALELEVINPVSSVPDTQDEDILRLYRAGILSGSDGYGSFAAGRHLTRAEAAAALARIVEPALRVRFAPQQSPYQGYTLTPLADVDSVMGPNYPVAPILFYQEDDGQAGGLLTLEGRMVDYPEGRIYSSGVGRSYDYLHLYVIGPDWSAATWLMDARGDYAPPSGQYQSLYATGDGHFLAGSSWSDGEVDHTSWYLLSPDGSVETELPETLGSSWNSWYGYNEGLCPWMDEDTGLWGYVDATGSWAVAPTWQSASSFEGGYAVLCGGEGRYAIMDRGGQLVLPFQDKSLTLPRCSPGHQTPGLVYWENWRMDTGLMSLDGGTLYSLPDTVSSPIQYYNGYAVVWDETAGGGYYLDSQARRISETFSWCGDIGPDGQGFVGMDGKAYRIQFQ